MAAVLPDGNYDSAIVPLTDSAEHTVYTVPAGYRAVMITQIWCAEIAGGARTITLKARLSGVDYVLVSGAAIAANLPYDAEFKPLVLKNGDSIKATASASTVNVMVSFVAVQSGNR